MFLKKFKKIKIINYLLFRCLLTFACTRHFVQSANIGHLFSLSANLQEEMWHMRQNKPQNLDIRKMAHGASTRPMGYK